MKSMIAQIFPIFHIKTLLCWARKFVISDGLRKLRVVFGKGQQYVHADILLEF